MSRWNTPKENDPYPFTPMRTTTDFLFLSPLAFQHSTFIADVWPHARTRGGRGCRPHGLDSTNSVSPNMSTVSNSLEALSSNIPGPLTFRMMERVWSSMNSTRTWVTPPREPMQGFLLAFSVVFLNVLHEPLSASLRVDAANFDCLVDPCPSPLFHFDPNFLLRRNSEYKPLSSSSSYIQSKQQGRRRNRNSRGDDRLATESS